MNTKRHFLTIALCAILSMGNVTAMPTMQTFAQESMKSIAKLISNSLYAATNIVATHPGWASLPLLAYSCGAAYCTYKANYPLKITQKTSTKYISSDLPQELSHMITSYGSYVEHTTISSWYYLSRAKVLFLTNNQIAFAKTCNGSTITIVDGKTGKYLRKLTGHTVSVGHLAELPNHTLASGDYNGTIKIWNMRTGQCLHTLEGHAAAITDLLPLAGGRLASADCNGMCNIWNTHTGNCTHTYVIPNGNPHHSTQLATLTEGTLTAARISKSTTDQPLEEKAIIQKYTWNIQTNTLIENMNIDTSLSYWNTNLVATFLSDNSIAMFARGKQNRGVLYIYQIDTDEYLHTLAGHSSLITSCIALPNGNIVTCSYDDTIKIWDPLQGNCLQTIPSYASELIVLPEGKFASIDDKKQTISIWGLDFEIVPAQSSDRFTTEIELSN